VARRDVAAEGGEAMGRMRAMVAWRGVGASGALMLPHVPLYRLLHSVSV
jgi:hypothetical protein